MAYDYVHNSNLQDCSPIWLGLSHCSVSSMWAVWLSPHRTPISDLRALSNQLTFLDYIKILLHGSEQPKEQNKQLCILIFENYFSPLWRELPYSTGNVYSYFKTVAVNNETDRIGLFTSCTTDLIEVASCSAKDLFQIGAFGL